MGLGYSLIPNPQTRIPTVGSLNSRVCLAAMVCATEASLLCLLCHPLLSQAYYASLCSQAEFSETGDATANDATANAHNPQEPPAPHTKTVHPEPHALNPKCQPWTGDKTANPHSAAVVMCQDLSLPTSLVPRISHQIRLQVQHKTAAPNSLPSALYPQLSAQFPNPSRRLQGVRVPYAWRQCVFLNQAAAVHPSPDSSSTP